MNYFTMAKFTETFEPMNLQILAYFMAWGANIWINQLKTH